MKRLPFGEKLVFAVRIFEAPRFASVQRSGLHVANGFLRVDVMLLAAVFVETGGKSDENFVAPGPDPMGGRPTAVAIFLGIDFSVACGIVSDASR